LGGGDGDLRTAPHRAPARATAPSSIVTLAALNDGGGPAIAVHAGTSTVPTR
jgi:hypothetical protein